MKKPFRRGTSRLKALRNAGMAPITKVRLPPHQLRAAGAHFAANEAFLDSASRDAARLAQLVGLSVRTDVLDLGCGAGRLAIGMIETGHWPHSYIGLDVRYDVIAWCQRQITRRWPEFVFIHHDLSHARYNPTSLTASGTSLDQIAGESIDAVHAYSVFSHLAGPAAEQHLVALQRVLRPNGAAVITAFVESGVPAETVNPKDYGDLEWAGPLHCVRFSVDHFTALINHAGLRLESLEHGVETDGQSLLLIRRAG